MRTIKWMALGLALVASQLAFAYWAAVTYKASPPHMNCYSIVGEGRQNCLRLLREIVPPAVSLNQVVLIWVCVDLGFALSAWWVVRRRRPAAQSV